MEGNREFKSDVFSMLMEDRTNALQVYNALNDTDYDNPDLVEVHTLEKGVSLSLRNDAAIVVGSDLSLYEHQSTVCLNMPLRQLFYVCGILRNMINPKELFKRELVRIPTPKFAVFYNGAENQPDEVTLRLSDAFEKQVDQPELELTCKVYNINQGKNRKLLDRCRILDEYMIFVNYVRYYQTQYGVGEIRQAITAAIDRCLEEDVLVKLLKERREEVTKVIELDMTFERQLEAVEEEALTKGIQIGEERGIQIGEDRLTNLIKILKKQGREDDVNKVLLGGEEREKLYAEFSL